MRSMCCRAVGTVWITSRLVPVRHASVSPLRDRPNRRETPVVDDVRPCDSKEAARKPSPLPRLEVLRWLQPRRNAMPLANRHHEAFARDGGNGTRQKNDRENRRDNDSPPNSTPHFFFPGHHASKHGHDLDPKTALHMARNNGSAGLFPFAYLKKGRATASLEASTGMHPAGTASN